jgi:predicted metalloprotease with PDZ domain
VHPVDGTAYLYYPKGSLAGFLLDMMIRDASDNRRSLDDVMRGLYQTVYKSGRGFTGQDWWSAVARAAGGPETMFTDFAARYVDGREPLPWARVLPLAGLRLRRDNEPRLGVYTLQDSAGTIVVTQLEEGGSAALAGVREGDRLVSVGEIAVNDERFAEKFRAKFGAATEGAPLSIRVRRGTESLTLAGKLRFVPGDARIEPDAKASAKAARIRNGIIKGSVDR